jgi:hypothetical protein
VGLEVGEAVGASVAVGVRVGVNVAVAACVAVRVGVRVVVRVGDSRWYRCRGNGNTEDATPIHALGPPGAVAIPAADDAAAAEQTPTAGPSLVALVVEGERIAVVARGTGCLAGVRASDRGRARVGGARVAVVTVASSVHAYECDAGIGRALVVVVAVGVAEAEHVLRRRGARGAQ